MNTVNSSTGYSGFQLRLGMSPRLIPPIVKDPVDNTNETPLQFMERLALDVGTASDNLLDAKILQADQANKRGPDVPYSVGDKALLSTKNLSIDEQGELLPPTRRLRHKFVGPFNILRVDMNHSTATLDILGPTNKCRTFHFSLLKPYHAFVDDSVPADTTPDLPTDTSNPEPGMPPVKNTRSGDEHYIRDLIAHEKRGYLKYEGPVAGLQIRLEPAWCRRVCVPLNKPS